MWFFDQHLDPGKTLLEAQSLAPCSGEQPPLRISLYPAWPAAIYPPEIAA